MTDHREIEVLSAPFDQTVRPPGSKSETIRALFVAALSSGTSRLHHPLDADDTRSALQTLRQLGVVVDDRSDPWVVSGTGGLLQRAGAPLDAGASGLTARALIAMAALVEGPTTITGRDRLPSRPMGGLLAALDGLGIEVSSEDGHLPVTVHGVGRIPGGRIEVASAETTQHLTALLIVAPLATGRLTLVPTGLKGSLGYLALSRQVMGRFGAAVEEVGGELRVDPTGYRGTEIEIEPDASAAVYPMVAAAITGSRVTIAGLGAPSLQPDMEIARVLQDMGCQLTQGGDATTLSGPGRALDPIDADLSAAPDGSLAVAVACLFASGPSHLRGLGSLRFKESDRLAAIATEIGRLGAGAEVEGDRLTIVPGRLHPVRVETYRDHRMAMALALVGLVTPGIEVSDPSVVAKTWPGYWEMLDGLARPRG
jgi:3-phosphoshikimate 1-carboxyvinyltransferase